MARVCARAGVSAALTEALLRLSAVYGTPDEVLPVLAELAEGDEVLGASLTELKTTLGALSPAVRGMIRLDFSLVSDMTYYNGIVFRGYVKGVPDAVLSGGRYDKLMRRLGRRSDAIGFAVYLDRLVCYGAAHAESTFDVAVLYDDTTDLGALTETVAALTAGGERVTALRALPDGVTVGRVVKLGKEGN
jgi:ATP phosphoribosyltransferase regulatory subunit